MNPGTLDDHTLHHTLKQLVQKERELTTKVLGHLREVERRKLFCDFGRSSLFDYAVHELGYSEGQAHRRIQAMRLIRELPQLEKKIESGELSLTNAAQAQSFFRNAGRSGQGKALGRSEKLDVLKKLEGKSTREGQRELNRHFPDAPLPREHQRKITPDKTEIKMIIDESTRRKLEEVRSLLGPKGAEMSLADLMAHMAEMCVTSLKAKKFGRKRTAAEVSVQPPPQERTVKSDSDPVPSLPVARGSTPVLPAPEVKSYKNKRYIPQSIKHQVWLRDGGKCCKCSSRRNLCLDHIKPVALGGESTPDNLRILCFNCNQREAIKVFGAAHIQKMSGCGNNHIAGG